MGRNVDLVRMCGLPPSIEYKGKTYDIEDQLRDYDIDDDYTNPEDGIWVLNIGLYGELCFKIRFEVNSKITKIELED